MSPRHHPLNLQNETIVMTTFPTDSSPAAKNSFALPGINSETFQMAGLKHVDASTAVPLTGTEQPGLLIPYRTIDGLPVMEGQSHSSTSRSISYNSNKLQSVYSSSPETQIEKNQPQPAHSSPFMRPFVHRKNLAEEALAAFGEIDWHDDTTGYITCPGQHLHTTRDGHRDCQVKIDGTPTVFCQHQSCKKFIEDANRELRKLMETYQVLGGLTENQTGHTPKIHVKKSARIEAFGAEILKELRRHGHEGALDALLRTSPVQIPDDNGAQLKLFMSLLPPQDIFWIGNKEDSGSQFHAKNFKSAKTWASEGAPKYPFLCTSSFKPGSFSRSKKNVIQRNLIVFECDKADLTLARKLASKEIPDDDDKRRNKEMSVALIRRLQNDLGLKLVAVVDSGNKSLHGYFRYPGDDTFAELKYLIPAMGGDPMVLGEASASRVPGYQDHERKQTLLYFDNTPDKSEPKLPSSLLPAQAFEQFGQGLTSLISSSVASSLTSLPTASSLDSYPAATSFLEAPPVSSLNSSTDVVPHQSVSRVTRTQKRLKKVTSNMPRPLGCIAYHGVAGRIVRKIEPHTEASPAALLMTLLTFTGTMIGKGAYVVTDGAHQYMNLFTLIIGSSSKARKGTSLANIERILDRVDSNFMSDNTASGLSSGEGLIAAVKDSVTQQAVNKTTGQLELKVLEPGVDDKRLIVAEGEFANALKVAKREGNTLSGILRNAWDGRDLRTMTRKDPLKSTRPHISVLAHITREELLKEMSDVDTVNGFANRFLFVASQREKLLPEGGKIGSVEFQAEIQELVQAIKQGQSAGPITRSPEAVALWRSTYEMLAKERPGLIGCITSRSEAQVTRLSALFALLDGSRVIQPVHHEAALEVWRYCEDSARWIFGMKTGQKLSDKILDALQRMSPDVMSRTEIFTKVMAKNGTAHDLDNALRLLLEYELIECWDEKTADGRVTELFRFAEGTNYTNSSSGGMPAEETPESKTTNSQADFVKFVGLSDHKGVFAAASRPDPLFERPTATSSFLSTPYMSTITNVNHEGMCEEEREHWNYYDAYGEHEAHTTHLVIKPDAKMNSQWAEK
jgi:hypothetical protein